MFFDDKKTDTRYQQLLLSIAHKQQELFLFRFDWKTRQPKAWPPKGLWKTDRRALAKYEDMLQELEDLKQATLAYRKKQGYLPGAFWWNISWEHLFNYLLYDLSEIEEIGPWRYARTWEPINHDGVTLLLLHEEGHCSDFTGQRSYEYEELSKYSASERSQMERDYRNRLNEYDMRNLMMINGPVRSTYGNVYSSMSSYLTSGDHYMHRSSLESSYSRSLYTEHHTTRVSVSSNSIHYECVFNVGGFHVDRNGMLDNVKLYDFEIISGRGSIPESLQDEYLEKDAAVVLAAYIADQKTLTAVPVQLFGKNITEGAANYSEAMRQSEIYTCLAHKLKYIDE